LNRDQLRAQGSGWPWAKHGLAARGETLTYSAFQI
jgi:hypothetical protein